MKEVRNVASLLIVNVSDYFSQVVEESCEKLAVDLKPGNKKYLSELLNFYLDARNLYDEPLNEVGERQPTMLSEMYLQAQNETAATKAELLKKLGDRSLYIAGYFSDSLKRKIVDVDFYLDIGGVAFYELSQVTREEASAHVFREISHKFREHTDVLNFVAESHRFNEKEDLMRIYEKYILTGSPFAKLRLEELGIMPPPDLKKAFQDD